MCVRADERRFTRTMSGCLRAGVRPGCAGRGSARAVGSMHACMHAHMWVRTVSRLLYSFCKRFTQMLDGLADDMAQKALFLRVLPNKQGKGSAVQQPRVHHCAALGMHEDHGGKLHNQGINARVQVVFLKVQLSMNARWIEDEKAEDNASNAPFQTSSIVLPVRQWQHPLDQHVGVARPRVTACSKRRSLCGR